MAKKRSAKQGTSASKRGRGSRDADQDSVKVSRKVLRNAAAPYERKKGDGGEDGEEKGGKKADGNQDAGAAKKETAAAKESSVKDPARDAFSKDDAAGVAKSAGLAPAGFASPDALGDAPARKQEPVGSKRAAESAAKGGEPDAGALTADAVPAGDEAKKPAVEKTTESSSDDKAAAPEAAAAPETAAAAPETAAAAPEATAEQAENEMAVLVPPRYIEDWDPQSPAPPPGKAPPGDSRSLRRHHEGVEEFVLIYRYGSFLITRAGRVGLQGKWTVVEYPTVGVAAHAYAQECSDLTSAGYRDLR